MAQRAIRIQQFWRLSEDVSKLKKIGQCFQVSIYFHPLHPWLRGTQREYSSKPLKHSIVKLILVFKR